MQRVEISIQLAELKCKELKFQFSSLNWNANSLHTQNLNYFYMNNHWNNMQNSCLDMHQNGKFEPPGLVSWTICTVSLQETRPPSGHWKESKTLSSNNHGPEPYWIPGCWGDTTSLQPSGRTGMLGHCWSEAPIFWSASHWPPAQTQASPPWPFVHEVPWHKGKLLARSKRNH